MNIQVSWLNAEQTVILAQTVRSWTWEDYYAAREQVNAQLNGVNHPVTLILNGNRYSLPSNALSNFGRYTWDNNTKIVQIILASKGAFLHAMFQMYLRLFPKRQKRVMMVRSLEEAHQHLRGHHDRSPAST